MSRGSSPKRRKSRTTRPIRKKSKLSNAYSEKRVALVIGNGAYNESPLRNPVNDAKAMTKVLTEVDFEVKLLTDATRKQMKNAIHKFGNKLHQGGVGLFYFAGHGVQVNGKNYLIPVGAEIYDEYDVEEEAVNVGIVLGRMDKAKNRVNILILDACRSNPYQRSFRSVNRGLAMIDAPRGTLIEYSTAPGMIADDGTEANSPYTEELLNYILLENVEVVSVFRQVRGKVIKKTKGRQIPWEISSFVGDFFFRPTIFAKSPLKPKFSFRSTPIGNLYGVGVEEILLKNSFYESSWNKDGKGILSEYTNKTINNDIVIGDATTGLIWQKSGSSKTMPYNLVNTFIDQLNQDQFAGFSDWRLPTLEEVLSLMEPERKGNNLFIDPVFDSSQKWIWTADRLNRSEIWSVNFYYGVIYHSFANHELYVRAVRSIHSS